MPRTIDWVTSLSYIGVIVVYLSFYRSGFYPTTLPGWLAGLVIMATLLTLLTLDRFEYWRYNDNSPPLTLALLLVVRIILIFLASLSDGFGLFVDRHIVVLLIPFVLFFISGSSYGLSGQAWVLYLLARIGSYHGGGHPLVVEGPDVLFLIVLGLTFTFFIALAYLTRQEKKSRLQTEQLLHELKASHRQLRAYADRVAELATTEERNRLAREIHDSLGHYLTVINVQLEKAMAFRERDPRQADQAVKNAKHLAREALKDIRRSVGALRQTEDSFSVTKELAILVRNASNYQLDVSLQIDGDETKLSHQSLITLYRAAQEGLTNIQKHAQASQASIRVQFNDRTASLTIRDDGRGFDPATLDQLKNKGHYGLAGVRERLELIHGSFNLESNPDDGTTLMITVPKDPIALITATTSEVGL